jgi:DNA-binding MarR family transcriptional regulator
MAYRGKVTNRTRKPTTSGQDVQEAISRIFLTFSRDVMRRRLLGTEGSDLGPADVGLLQAIASQQPVRLSVLAAWQGVDKSTITPRVRRLEAAGLVDRQPDPADGRAALLSVTRQGATLLTHFSSAGAGLFEEMLGSWSAADRRQLGRLLQRLATGVEDAAHHHRRSRAS